MKKDLRIIGIDIDEVLAETFPAFLGFMKDHHNLILEPHQFVNSRWWEAMGVSKEECDQKVFHFHRSDHFKGIKPLDGAITVTQQLKNEYKLVAITARHDHIRSDTLEWIEEHFPETFSDIIFTNHFSGHAHQKTKAEVCKDLNVQLFVEDNDDFALQIAEAGVHTVLFDYPWNKKLEHQNLVRVFSWADAARHIKARKL